MQNIIAPINPTTTQIDAIANLQDVLQFLVRIIGCAMKVHNKMELGFQEVICQRCLAIQLELADLAFVREQEQTQ